MEAIITSEKGALDANSAAITAGGGRHNSTHTGSSTRSLSCHLCAGSRKRVHTEHRTRGRLPRKGFAIDTPRS